jgi:CubicO group peptidase (beta-lactamase class C family)
MHASDLQSALAPIFEENFARRGELGATVSVWRDGVEIVSLSGGFRDRERTRPWHAGTLALVYSATKGPAAACVLKCLWEAGIPLETPVASVWPRFAQAGKGAITFADVLAHRAGLAALDRPPDVFDYPAVIRALEEQAPLWPAGDGHGYHPRTSGYLWDEIVRLLTGKTLGEYWRRAFARPLGLDFWIGLPPERLPDVAPLAPARSTPAEDAFLIAYAEPGSLTNRAFGSPTGLFSVSLMNTPKAMTASFPAFGGIGSATALARFYGALACGGEEAGISFIPPEAVAAMSHRLANGFDRVLRLDNAFSAGFLQDPVDEQTGRLTRTSFGPSTRAFGQVGAGGSITFADPDRGIGFAYVMNQMEPGVLPNEKSLRLIRAMYEALE